MGHHATIAVETGGSTEHEAVPSAPAGSIWTQSAGTPVAGGVQRNGRTIPFTLETGHVAPEVPHVMTEHLVMAALLVVSFIVPIFHLLG